LEIDYKNRIFGLDLVRALAIVLVLISHCVLLIAPDNTGVIATTFKLGGALGVDIFFVLSGFLIGGILIRYLDEDKTSFIDLCYFWIRRWFRTLPNYYFILFLNILLGYFVFKNLPDDVLNYFFFFQNFNTSQSEFFTESWSLTIEEFSYIIGPALIFLLLYLKINKNKIFFISTLLIISIGLISKQYYNLNIENFDYHLWTTNVRKVVLYRIDCVYYGFLSVYLFNRYLVNRKKYINLFFYLGGAILILTHVVLFVTKATVVNASFFFDICYLPLVSSCFGLMMWKMASMRSGWYYLLKPITFLSLLSYSIYLINYSIILLLLKKYIPFSSGIIDKIGIVFLFLGLTTLFSYILFRFYEKPTINLRNHPLVLKFFNQVRS